MKYSIKHPKGIELIWESKETSWNSSSVIVDGDYLYGHSMKDSILKVDIRNGKIIWKRYSNGTYATLTPQISNNTVLVGGANTLKAFDKNGDLLWTKNTDITTNGLTVKDHIIYNTRTSIGLFANDIVTGEELWSIIPNYQMLSMSQPILIDSLLILGNFDYEMNSGDHLTCININNREIKWKIPNKGYTNGVSIRNQNNLIISSDSSYEKGVTYNINALNGHISWKTVTNPNLFYKPKIYKNKVFIPSYKHGIVCLNIETGKILWKINKTYSPHSKLLLHNGVLYIKTSENGFIGINEYGNIVFESDNFSGGNSFIYKNSVHIFDSRGRLYKIKNNKNITIVKDSLINQ